jgi:hypothetical protein
MARILVLDTLKHPSNSGTANITLSSDETTTMPTVNINGGQIDSTAIGASSPSSVAATTLSASGNATVGGTFGITGNTTVGGTFGVTGATTMPTVDINGGAIDGTTIGASSASTIAATTITASGNTTLSGSANTVGTVTAGTINEAVIMTGVPRKTRFVLVNPTEGQYQHGATNTTQTATHDGVAFSAISGKTYLIKVYYVTDAGNSTNDIAAWSVHLYHGTSQVSRGATSGFGTQLNYHGFNYRVQGINGENNVRGGHQIIFGVFTASTTQTEYIQLTMYNNNQTTVSYMQFQSTNPFCLMEIQEFDSNNFTTET